MFVCRFLDLDAEVVDLCEEEEGEAASSFRKPKRKVRSSPDAEEVEVVEGEASEGYTSDLEVLGSESGRSVRGGAAAKSRPRKAFRVSGKQFALTYPKCPVSRADFDSAFRLQHVVAEFASARELHEDGTHHLHLFVAFAKRVDVQSARYFDLSFEGKVYHPNVQLCRNKSQWLTYISKGDDHGVDELRRVLEDPLSYPIGKRKSTAQDLKWSAEERIRRSLRPISYPIVLACEGKQYEMFKPDPRVKKRSWWIVAPPNAGKTRWINKQFAMCAIYCPRMGKYPYEGYGDEDVIIYDDRKGVGFEEFSDVLNTWEFLHPVYGEVRFTTQNWKLGHTRSVIVLSNKTIEESCPEEDWLRMKKRFIQIVNPVLIPPEEMSDDEEVAPPAAASAAAQGLDYDPQEFVSSK